MITTITVPIDFSHSYKLYQVKGGTPSVLDDFLESNYTYTFNSETILLTKSYPMGGSHGLSPIMFASFDQKVDPIELSKVIKCFVHGPLGIKKLHGGVTLLNKDDEMKKHGLNPENGVVFTTAKPFPYDSMITVQIGPSIPSVEGSLLSPITYTFSFNTIPPFAVHCTWKVTCL